MFGEERADCSGPPREARLGGDLAVGHDVARFELVEHGDDGPLEVGQVGRFAHVAYPDRRREGGTTMSDKPSYLSLLNYLTQAESEAHIYLTAWAGVTPSDDVRDVLLKVAAREGEHGMSFLKRMEELGYHLKPRETDCEKLTAIASSDKTDLEKFEIFKLGQLDQGDGPDPFDDFFNDHSIDLQTGGLLGRYICEERDTARLLRSCYEQLKAADRANGKGKSDRSDSRQLKALDKKVDALCRAVDELRQIVVAQAMPANAK
jgi:hypothetical protein